MSEPLLIARGVTKAYRMGSETLPVLKDLDLTLMPGEAVAVVGASGVGKSTLLHVLGLLDAPDEGEVICSGTELSALPPDIRAEWRNRMFGFVFQFYHLIPELSALENTMLPAMMRPNPENASVLRARAREILTDLGLLERLRHRPSQLSGGERQRVAIARSLMNDPAVILCDEPTGNLDPATSVGVQKALWGLREKQGQAMLLVTHDTDLAARADRVLRMEDGRLVEERGASESPNVPEMEPVPAVEVRDMPLSQALLSLEGRIGLDSYWLRGLLPTLLIGAAVNAAYQFGAGSNPGMIPALGLFIVNLFLTWPLLATAVKRCHDRNRSGLFLGLGIGCAAILGILAFFVLSLGLPVGYWLIGVLPGIALLWVLVELWFFPGTAGSNRYGANPRRPIYGYRPG